MNVNHYVSSCALGVKYSVEIENLFFFVFCIYIKLVYAVMYQICTYVYFLEHTSAKDRCHANISLSLGDTQLITHYALSLN